MIEDYYTDLTYKTPTVAKNTGGMETTTWSSAVSFKGYIWQLSGREQRMNSKNTVVSTHGLVFDPDIALKKNYAVFDADGNEYKIVSIPRNPGNQSHHKRCDLEFVN